MEYRILKSAVALVMLSIMFLIFAIFDSDTGIKDFIKNNKTITFFIVVSLISVGLIGWMIIKWLEFN